MKQMTRREFLMTAGRKASAVGILSVLPQLITIGCADRKQKRPNVILVITDDQGWGDLGVHGNDQIHTPHIDRFAMESVGFNRFYCSPVCSPTRASLMTGRYNYRTGVVHTSRGGAKMHGEEITLAEVLNQAGYRTGIFGKWHLGDNYPMRPIDQGFEESLIHTDGGLCQAPDLPNDYFNPKCWHNGKPVFLEGYCADIFTDAAIRFIQHHRKEQFFIYLATNTPHNPLIVSEDYSQPYFNKGLGLDLAKLYGMITNIDDNFGRILEILNKLNLEENTLVIFMTDNGPASPSRYNGRLRGSKGTVYEGGIRVPFYIRWPMRLEGGSRTDYMAAHIDIFPTILHACGIDLPSDRVIDGVDLMPVLLDKTTKNSERKIFIQFHRGMLPIRYQNCAVCTKRYKLVSVYGDDSERGSHASPLNALFELYDLENDPGEQKNIASEKPDIVDSLKSAYEFWFLQMKNERNFDPGLIHIGTEYENPLHLCRYQDSSYINNKPQGWPVVVERNGLYEILINRFGYMDPGSLFIQWQGETISQSIEKGVNHATFPIKAGTGILDIWFVERGQERIIFTKNHTIGDVDIRFICDIPSSRQKKNISRE